MTQAPRFSKDNSKDNSEELPQDLVGMGSIIGDLPEEHRGKLQRLYQRVVENTRRRRRILNLVQEALSQLRLDMKYLVFDLEATRRERDDYRARVEEDGNRED